MKSKRNLLIGLFCGLTIVGSAICFGLHLIGGKDEQ